MKTELISKLKERFEKTPDNFSLLNQNNPIWLDFSSKFPAETLSEMSLDDYCMGGENKQGNFCWWLEVGLEPVFGTYSAGSARSHILFRQKRDGLIYKHRYLKDLSDNEALQYVLKITQLIATAPNLDKAQEFDDDKNIYNSLGLEPRVTMGDARKLRVYTAYHPDSALPINSSKHIELFLGLFGVKNIASGPFGKSRQLWTIYEDVKKEIPDLSPRGFTRVQTHLSQ
jgi:5-methylcytosine-specific restriction protein B